MKGCDFGEVVHDNSARTYRWTTLRCPSPHTLEHVSAYKYINEAITIYATINFLFKKLQAYSGI